MLKNQLMILSSLYCTIYKEVQHMSQSPVGGSCFITTDVVNVASTLGCEVAWRERSSSPHRNNLVSLGMRLPNQAGTLIQTQHHYLNLTDDCK